MTKAKKVKPQVVIPPAIILFLVSFFFFSFSLFSSVPSLAQPCLCSSHVTSSRGPHLECSYCHDDPFPGHLKKGLNLADTGICNECHSPGGQFNGVADPIIGAKANWDTGVYDGTSLQEGKEKWCAGCHDDSSCNIGGISASNIVGLCMTGGNWQTPVSVIYPDTLKADYLIDDDPSSGMMSREVILDLGNSTKISHIKLYIGPNGLSFWKVYGSNDLSSWDRIIFGPSVIFSAPVWPIGPKEGWAEIRLDSFFSLRYLKLVKANPWPLRRNYLREFKFKKELHYGYYETGHKINCDNCHNTAGAHIDGVARTYSADIDNYQTGYRLKSVEVGEETVPPMEIPRVGYNNSENPRTSNDFALCFNCHDKHKLLGDFYGSGDSFQDPLSTNFRNDSHLDNNEKVKNEHLRHLRGRYYCGNGKDWDSDWDGVADSPQSCPACHDIHGSPTPIMTRHGELASPQGTLDKTPMFNFQYLNTEGKADPDLRNVMQSTGGKTQFWAPGPGTITKNNTCNMCHNDRILYQRTPISSPITNCQGCHHDMASHPSHATHLENDPRGPSIACKDCHSDGSAGSPHLRLFADGQTLEATTVCDRCHSEDGPFKGVSDSVIGARVNWQDGVYRSPDRLELKEGREDWCAGCHDKGTSVCSGVSAPNVMGDNSTYGYNITGHKIACSACHDLTAAHLDSDARTYSHNSNPTNAEDLNNYQNGYRLKYEMIIPLGAGPQGGYAQDRFALCFECHDYDKLMGDTPPYETNFQDSELAGQVNRHRNHLTANATAWDSDWDYDPVFDSRMSCPACHNVHGSPTPAMIRHGELISTPETQDKVPALDFRWYKADHEYTITFFGEESGYGDMPSLGGAGGGNLAESKVCFGCHGGPSPIKYDRTYQSLLMPLGSWAIPPLPPSLRCLDPDPGSTDITIDHTVSFILFANGTDDLNFNTLSISLKGSGSYDQTYGYGDSEVVVSSIPGQPYSYEVVVYPSVNFGDQESITVTVSIQDMASPVPHNLTSPDWNFETGLSSPVIWRSPQSVYAENYFCYSDILIDDHLETGNPAIVSGAHGVIYDLGQSYQVSQVRLLIPSPSGRTWTISVSDDPNSFGTPVIRNWQAEPDSITVDNTEASLTDVWPTSTSPTGYYGIDYQIHTTVIGYADATCTWTPQIPTTAIYKVYARWIGDTDRASDVTYTINYDGGSESVTVNQQNDGSKWNLLGTYLFEAGTYGSIVLGNNASSAGLYVVADAIRLVEDASPAWWVTTSFTPKQGKYFKLYTGKGPLALDSIREVDFAESIP